MATPSTVYKGFYISVRVTSESSTARRYSIFSQIRQRENDAKPFQGFFKTSNVLASMRLTNRV